MHGARDAKQKFEPIILGKIIEKRVFLIRGHRVMLDSDLAELYEVPTLRLNEAVKRNSTRFPEDFMFRLTSSEWEILRSQFAISKSGHGGRRYTPHAFTENGVAMLSSVLNSEQAVQVNIVIMRTFNRLREVLGDQATILRRLDSLEKTATTHGAQIHQVFQAIRDLVAPQVLPKRKIGIGRGNR